MAGTMRRMALAVCVLCATVAPAHAESESFDGFPGVIWSGGAVGPASRISNDLASSIGAVFSTQGGADYATVVDLTTGFGGPHAPTVPNGVAGATLAGTLTYSLPVRISFVDPAHPSRPATTDSVSIQGDLAGNGVANFAHLEAYDVDGQLIATDSNPDAVSGGPGVLTVSVSGIRFVTVRSDDGTVAFDDLQFNTVVPVPLSVPMLSAPASSVLALLLVASVAMRRGSGWAARGRA